jgi:hypothetical protein
MPLTDTAIRNVKPGAKAQKLFHGGGLFLLVTDPARNNSYGVPVLPLARANVTKADVLSFWRAQPFDLALDPQIPPAWTTSVSIPSLYFCDASIIAWKIDR